MPKKIKVYEGINSDGLQITDGLIKHYKIERRKNYGCAILGPIAGGFELSKIINQIGEWYDYLLLVFCIVVAYRCINNIPETNFHINALEKFKNYLAGLSFKIPNNEVAKNYAAFAKTLDTEKRYLK